MSGTKRIGRRPWGTYVLYLVTLLGFVYLFVPLVTIAVFSFNKPEGRFNTKWNEFTLEHWKNPFPASDYTEAFKESIRVGVVACILATSARRAGRTRHRQVPDAGWPGHQPAARAPAHDTRDRHGLVAVHVVLQPGRRTRLLDDRARPHDVLPVLRRPHGQGAAQGDRLVARGCGGRSRVPTVADVREDHAADDRARIVAAFLLSMALSIDDYIITSFVAGNVSTFPREIFDSAKFEINPQVHVLATLIMLVAITILVAGTVLGNRRRAKLN